ncbi:MAG: hypothetical protein V4565_02335 [Bacteroidota bacterium]
MLLLLGVNLQHYKKNSPQLFLAISAGLGLLIYIYYKAAHLSFTHDECYTYLHYVHQDFMDIISYKTPYTNNHILNTVLMKYSEEFFGRSELVLRLPNILAFIVYSFFAIKLLHTYSIKLLLPGYLLLTLHPYLLEFFALARGYGLSIAFLMASIYFACRYFSVLKSKYLIYFNGMSLLSGLSNFSLLNYYIAALLVFNMLSYIIMKLNSNVTEKKISFLKLNKINLVWVLISTAILYEPLRRISKMSVLDFGGKNGFISNTIGSSIDDLFYEMAVPDFLSLSIKGFTLTISCSILGLLLVKLIKKDFTFFKNNPFLVFTNLTLFINVLIMHLQHLVLNNDFYIHRFALFFYPLFILNLISFIYFLQLHYPRTGFFLSYFFALMLAFNFYKNHNFNYYKDWKYDKDTKIVIQRLVSEHEKYPAKQIKLGINWLFEPSTNFYRYSLNLKWLNPTHRNGITGREHYCYLFKNDPEFQMLKSWEILFKNEKTDVLFIKKSNY